MSIAKPSDHITARQQQQGRAAAGRAAAFSKACTAHHRFEIADSHQAPAVPKVDRDIQNTLTTLLCAITAAESHLVAARSLGEVHPPDLLPPANALALVYSQQQYQAHIFRKIAPDRATLVSHASQSKLGAAGLQKLRICFSLVRARRCGFRRRSCSGVRGRGRASLAQTRNVKARSAAAAHVAAAWPAWRGRGWQRSVRTGGRTSRLASMHGQRPWRTGEQRRARALGTSGMRQAA